jgi:hypothetical protein
MVYILDLFFCHGVATPPTGNRRKPASLIMGTKNDPVITLKTALAAY